MKSTSSSSSGHRGGAGLGTFAGVFTPSILTILGLVLFRRLAFVVGGAGVAQALVIAVAALAIAVLTTLSLSAIATNLRVKGGGDYYLISRSLGVEFGGAIGLVLYFAQSISIAFYCVGLGEMLGEILPPGAWYAEPRLLAGAAAVFLFAFAWAGADVATRMQYVVMTLLIAAIGSFFIGAFGRFSGDLLVRNWTDTAADPPSFWILFAIFFPAVTGFTQGVSMSGDLRDPQRSLPSGTFAAIAVSAIVYLGAVVVLGGSVPASELAENFDAMSRVSAMPWLIVAGILAATLSSALASFLGAPRILQALAGDGVFPLLGPFAVGQGAANNPRRGVLLSLGVALVFIAAGDINFIAPVVSMFFLISYGLLNYATAFEARANSPSFRPRFRWFHYRTSLLGAFGCLGAMVMISPVATAIAVSIVFALHQYTDRLGRPERWADSKRDHYFQSLRSNLLAFSKEPEHSRHWRPRILVFSQDSKRRSHLLQFASWIEGHAGLTTVVRIVEGLRYRLPKRCQKAEEQLREDISSLGLNMFTLVVAAPDPEIGAQTLLQSNGTGPLRANLAVMSWLHRSERADPAAHKEHDKILSRQLKAAVQMGVSIVMLDATASEWDALDPGAADQRIDIWWEDDASSRLSLLLAYMMTRTDRWARTGLRVLTPARSQAKRRTVVRLHEVLQAARINAEVETVDSWDADQLVRESRNASLVFLPLRMNRMSFRDPFDRPVEKLLADLPLVAMVLAAEDVELEMEPDTVESSESA